MAADGGASPPAAPPEAVLLRLARKAAGVTVASAARAAGISKAWLSSIENGYDNRGSEGIRPVRASDEIIARLAAFLNIAPDRLETEGGRPDAAAVLREMRRHPAGIGVPGRVPPLAGDPALEAAVEYVAGLPGLSPRDRAALEHVAASPGLDTETRLLLVDLTRAMIARQGARERPA